MEKPHLYVIDAHNLLYKAHFTFQRKPLINSKGRDVSVCYGVTNMLMKLLKEHQPRYLAMAFDRKAPTFRHELYKQYKLNRPPMPAPIADNLSDVKRIVRAFGILILEQDGYEADDILGTIVRVFEGKDVIVRVVTLDKDLLHLVRENVEVLAAKKGLSHLEIYDRRKVMEKFGVPPEKMVDLFALMGDHIDNVPGIPGIGPKTAARLLSRFDSLEDILDRVSEISSEKMRRRIEENRDFGILSKRLIQLKTTAEVPDKLDAYRIGERDETVLREIFETLEFRRLLDDLGPAPATVERRVYELLTRRDELVELARRIRGARRFALDTETTSEDPVQAELVGLSFAFSPLEAYYVPVGHRTGGRQADMNDVRNKLGTVLSDPSIEIVGQNIKYDWIVLRKAGVDLKGVVFDTMIASYLLDPGRKRHNLDALAERFLNIRKIPVSTFIGKKGKAETMDLLPPSDVMEYACEDADVTFRLYDILQSRLKQESGLYRLFIEIEMPLVPVLVDMELSGIRLDVTRLSKLSEEVAKMIGELTEEIYILAGESFNINSTQQLSKILFEKLGFPTRGIKKTKSGYSTAERELMKLVSLGALFNELPHKILEYRSLTKLKNTYLDTLPSMVNPNTGRIHTHFNQAVTETGRLSSSDPNLQNIPIRTALGKRIREAFIPSEGCKLISADYSQMELRILAHVSGDESLRKAFEAGVDVHSATASRLFGVPLDAVTPEQRRRAKMVNFGIDYGMTPFGLAERLGIDRNEARLYIEKYLKEYKGVAEYIQSIRKQVSESGYVETLLGRRRYIPLVKNRVKSTREMGYRQAINMPIQGTAADIIKIAMIRIHRALKEKSLKTRMVLQIHDELLFDAPVSEVDTVKSLVTHEMEHAFKMDVPLVVDIRDGSSWAEIH